MIVTRESAENGDAVLRIEVDQQRFQKHFNAALRRVNQRVDVPGFRRGKAHPVMLQNHVGKEVIVDEAMEPLVNEVVELAVEQEDVELYRHMRPSVNVETTEPNVVLTVTIPTVPTVGIGDYAALRYDDTPDEVTEEDVEARLLQIRQGHAFLKPAERPAEDGDTVTCDMRVSADGETVWEFEDRQFRIRSDLAPEGESEILSGIFSGLVGVSEGDEKQFAFDVPETSQSENFAGKTVDVWTAVNDVQEEIIPELDPSMADGAGFPDVETVEQLTERVRDSIAEVRRSALDRRIENQFIDDIVEASEFVISPKVIDFEAAQVLDNFIRERRFYEQYGGPPFREEDITPERLDEAKQAAELQIKRETVINKIVEIEAIDISDEDVDAEIQRHNEDAQSEDQKVDAADADTRMSVVSFLKRRRTIDRLLDKARAGNANPIANADTADANSENTPENESPDESPDA